MRLAVALLPVLGLTGALAGAQAPAPLAARAVPTGAWLDASPLATWNTTGAPVPAATKEGEWRMDDRCSAAARPPSERAADRAVTAAGWTLFGPLQVFGATELVTAATATDGMCRPMGYQAFVFVDGRFAGTLSPTPMAARSDGIANLVRLLSPTGISAEFARYTEQDPLCCPSRTSSVHFEVEVTAPGVRVVPTSVTTQPNEEQ